MKRLLLFLVLTIAASAQYFPPGGAGGGGGTGDVVGPSSATDTAITIYNSTTGKLIKNSGCTINSSNVVSCPGGANFGTGSGKTGYELFSGATSGGAGFTTKDIAGTATLYMLPDAGGASGTYLADTGSATCPTLSAGAPTACRQLAWSTPGGGGGGISNSIGAVASLPGSGTTAGDQYNTNDSIYKFIWTGAAWSAFFGAHPVTQPPLTGWTNLTGGTWDTTNGYPYFSVAASGSAALQGEYRTSPSAPYTITALINADVTGQPPGTNTGAVWGYGLALSDGTKFVTFMVYDDSSGPSYWTAKWTNSSSLSATYKVAQATTDGAKQIVGNQPKWLYITNDGSNNLNFGWTVDGFHLKQFDTRTANDFLGTITRFAIVTLPQNAAIDLGIYSLTGF